MLLPDEVELLRESPDPPGPSNAEGGKITLRKQETGKQNVLLHAVLPTGQLPHHPVPVSLSSVTSGPFS